ncbi:efflux RND transporter permease subunit [Arenimonas fontis]|uniref:Efflux RND transporter permease subunit n=1 Tax=Arenimonas fontis TaxID=2608255 RepID=A0A5B2ZCJ8_9GAMM|nr:efflux RND transporter permease subunit [Arenimonas fontis]KAA2285293.1 efflux RND transporter permease subunit [Arenimonas fontis]
MVLSDLSIRRPVLATVMSLMLVALGLISFSRLTLRELPDIDPPIVSIDGSYTGASAAVVETRMTQVLEDAIAGIEGIRSVESRSRNGGFDITIEFSLDRDIESATNDVRSAVSRVLDRLPQEADPPEVEKVAAGAEVVLWLALQSRTMDQLELADYAERYIVDRLSVVDGVANVRVGGAQRYAMRIWLDRQAMAARGLTVADVEEALRRENVELPAGRLESASRDFTLRVERAYQGPEDFERLAVAKGPDGHIVRLGEIADVTLEAADRRAYYRGDGLPQVGLGVIKTSTANSLDVAEGIRSEMARIAETLPEGTTLDVSYDATVFIQSAVNRVYMTLLEAILLVLVVIYLFLGSARAALIPAVTVPVCLIAAFLGLYLFGFSINLLTLLALVLCIGLVVDDAIIVLENCQRRADLGEPPLVAARRGTRQVAFAVIATTAVLISVFLPVAFMEGNNGRLFRELAVTMAGAIALSAFVALSLTPMMCSLLVRPHTAPRGLDAWVHRRLARLTEAYRRLLEHTVGRPVLFIVAMLATFALTALLFAAAPRELAPPEDRGSFFVSVSGPEGAGFDYTVGNLQEIERRLLAMRDGGEPIHRVISRAPAGWGSSEEMHTGQAIVILSDWGQREQTTDEVVAKARRELAGVPGVRAVPIVRQGLVRSSGQPLQVVLGGPSYEELARWRDRMVARMEQNPNLLSVDSDYKETRPQMRIEVDRARAADLGVSAQEIGRTLETMMGSRRVTTFVDDGEEYDVVLQARQADRASPADLSSLYVRSQRSGELVPLSSLVTLTEVAEPGTLNRYNRLRAITLEAGLAPGYTLGEALDWVRQVAAEELPDYAQLDYKGESLEYQRAGGTVLFTFAMALLIVYLVLAAQFESFLHPIVIMLTVPLAVLGALIGLWLMGSTLNLFSQIGIIMLVGLAAKNGILIVEFANQLRDEGRAVREAILEASATRLRPILMTSIATIFGAVPLVTAGGAGSASRVTIGIVVIFGVAFSTLLSLFVIPAFYALLAPYTRSPEAVARRLEKLERETPSVGGHA